ncbi:MAG: Crp/Fnr family transcriptional regulator [Actinomycetota bacterium]
MDTGHTSGNLLLDSMDQDERERLLKGSELEEMAVRRVLIQPGKPIDRVFFPISGLVSLVTPMLDGGAFEMATVGREGVVGVPAALIHEGSSHVKGIARVSGQVISVDGDHLRNELERSPGLAGRVNEFLDALFTLAGQDAACHRLHNNEQRCARWLLMTHDRVGLDQFPLSYEFLSQMVGTIRESVTEAVGGLQDLGAIRYSRGQATIKDRKSLQNHACECYEVVAKAFESLYAPV